MINNNGGKREGNQESGEAQRWGKIETKTDGDLEEKVALISDGAKQGASPRQLHLRQACVATTLWWLKLLSLLDKRELAKLSMVAELWFL